VCRYYWMIKMLSYPVSNLLVLYSHFSDLCTASIVILCYGAEFLKMYKLTILQNTTSYQLRNFSSAPSQKSAWKLRNCSSFLLYPCTFGISRHSLVSVFSYPSKFYSLNFSPRSSIAGSFDFFLSVESLLSH
jgi:hypothetical protein